jgi:hypothetical protein
VRVPHECLSLSRSRVAKVGLKFVCAWVSDSVGVENRPIESRGNSKLTR